MVVVSITWVNTPQALFQLLGLHDKQPQRLVVLKHYFAYKYPVWAGLDMIRSILLRLVSAWRNIESGDTSHQKTRSRSCPMCGAWTQKAQTAGAGTAGALASLALCAFFLDLFSIVASGEPGFSTGWVSVVQGSHAVSQELDCLWWPSLGSSAVSLLQEW